MGINVPHVDQWGCHTGQLLYADLGMRQISKSYATLTGREVGAADGLEKNFRFNGATMDTPLCIESMLITLFSANLFHYT